MNGEHLFTVGVKLHVWAKDEDEMEKKVHWLWGFAPDMFVADWDMVEEYDPETDTVVQG